MEIDLELGTHVLQIIWTLSFSILRQSHVSIQVTGTDFILFQRKLDRFGEILIWYKHITDFKSFIPYIYRGRSTPLREIITKFNCTGLCIHEQIKPNQHHNLICNKLKPLEIRIKRVPDFNFKRCFCVFVPTDMLYNMLITSWFFRVLITQVRRRRIWAVWLIIIITLKPIPVQQPICANKPTESTLHFLVLLKKKH